MIKSFIKFLQILMPGALIVLGMRYNLLDFAIGVVCAWACISAYNTYLQEKASEKFWDALKKEYDKIDKDEE